MCVHVCIILGRGKHLLLDSQRCQDPKGIKNHSSRVLESKVLFRRGNFFFLGFQGTWQASTRWNSENNIMAGQSVLTVCPSAVSKRQIRYLVGWLLDFGKAKAQGYGEDWYLAKWSFSMPGKVRTSVK